MKIVINAGHTKFNPGTGAIGYLKESVENRKIACELMGLLANTDHEVIPAIIDSSKDNLKEAVKIANNAKADLFVSIHLNAGGGTGVEAFTWKGQQLPIATRICENISKMGYRNRGVKDGSKLYVIKNTKCPAILVECCFVDNKSDYLKYDHEEIAYAIYSAIMK